MLLILLAMDRIGNKNNQIFIDPPRTLFHSSQLNQLRAISLIYKRNLKIINHIFVISIGLDVYCYLHNYPVVYRRYCTL